MLSIAEKKDSLRREVLQRRLRLPFEEVFKLSTLIQERFLEVRELQYAKQLALYASFKNEVLTDAIFGYALAHGKEVFFPRIVSGKRGLVFLRVHGRKDFSQGSYKIHEPAHDRELDIIAPSSFDIIVVPGIAFDTAGNRLGYGKGYYDRVLGSLKQDCLVAAIAFDFQVLDRVPAEVHDIKMGMIITESRTINTAKNDGKIP